MPKSNYTPEKTAEYLINKYKKLFIEFELDRDYFCLSSALIVANEAIYISNKGQNAEWSNRTNYWEKVRQIIKQKLDNIDN